MSNRRRPPEILWGAGMAAFWGVFAFSGVAFNPRFEAYHTLDVIRLMTAGAAIAVTIMLLVKFFNRGSHTEDVWAEEQRGEESN